MMLLTTKRVGYIIGNKIKREASNLSQVDIRNI